MFVQEPEDGCEGGAINRLIMLSSDSAARRRQTGGKQAAMSSLEKLVKFQPRRSLKTQNRFL